MGRRLRRDRPPSARASCDARQGRGRRLPREPLRARARPHPLLPGAPPRARHAEHLLGEHRRPDAEAHFRWFHVRIAALDPGAGRRSDAISFDPRRRPRRLEREPDDGTRHPRAAARHPGARRQDRGRRSAPVADRRGRRRAPLHPARHRRAPPLRDRADALRRGARPPGSPGRAHAWRRPRGRARASVHARRCRPGDGRAGGRHPVPRP